MTKSYLLALRGFLFLVIPWSLSSCTSAPASKQQVLRHVVSLQFKAEVTPEQQAQAIQRFMDLTDEIPEIQQFEGGEDLSVEGLTQGFTHCFILTFADEAARDSYLPHPAHQRVADLNKPLLSKLLVMDVWGKE